MLILGRQSQLICLFLLALPQLVLGFVASGWMDEWQSIHRHQVSCKSTNIGPNPENAVAITRQLTQMAIDIIQADAFQNDSDKVAFNQYVKVNVSFDEHVSQKWMNYVLMTVYHSNSTIESEMKALNENLYNLTVEIFDLPLLPHDRIFNGSLHDHLNQITYHSAILNVLLTHQTLPSTKVSLYTYPEFQVPSNNMKILRFAGNLGHILNMISCN